VNADASTKVTVIDTQTNKEIAMSKLLAGNLRSVSFSVDKQSIIVRFKHFDALEIPGVNINPKKSE